MMIVEITQQKQIGHNHWTSCVDPVASIRVDTNRASVAFREAKRFAVDSGIEGPLSFGAYDPSVDYSKPLDLRRGSFFGAI